MEWRDEECIKYIDVTYGSCEAYIRYDTAANAQLFVQKSHEGRRLTILKGESISCLFVCVCVYIFNYFIFQIMKRSHIGIK